MSEIAVKVIDPGGQPWAQLLPSAWRAGDLVPPLVERLGLPTHLTYELVPRATGAPMGVGQTLAEVGVGPGAELLLRPVQDGPFQAFLDALYEEAVGFGVSLAWAQAEARLGLLQRLHPAYPDRAHLGAKLAAARASGALPKGVPPVGAPPVKGGGYGGGPGGYGGGPGGYAGGGATAAGWRRGHRGSGGPRRSRRSLRRRAPAAPWGGSSSSP